MIPSETDYLVPNAAFVVGLVIVILVIATFIWVLHRSIGRGSSTHRGEDPS